MQKQIVEIAKNYEKMSTVDIERGRQSASIYVEATKEHDELLGKVMREAAKNVLMPNSLDLY